MVPKIALLAFLAGFDPPDLHTGLHIILRCGSLQL